MPNGPKLVPTKARYTRPPKLSSAQRGYDSTHERLRLLVFGEQGGVCVCGQDFCVHLHHLDGNPFNRARSNVQGLCESCHLAAHGKQKRPG